MYQHDVLVIGAGLAGMRAAIEAFRLGADVAVLTKVHPVRSHSNAAQGGINACNKVARQQGYTCTVIRTEQRMPQAYEVLEKLNVQYRDLKLSDSGLWTNQNLSFAQAVGDMIIYAEATLAAALERKESRSRHYRPDYPQRDDES